MIPAIPSAVGDPSLASDAASTEQRHATQPDTSVQRSPGCKNEKRCGGQSGVFVSEESSHTTASIVPDPAATRCRNGDSAGIGARARRCDGGQCVFVRRLLIRPTWKRFFFFDAASEFDDHFTGEILDRDATIAGIRAELTQMQEFGVFEWKRKSEKATQRESHQHEDVPQSQGRRGPVKNCGTKYADGVFAPEHHAGTPPTWALKLVISRMMSKGRTRQLASHDVSVAFFHAWLERGVWVKPPKNLRLSDDWLGYVV